MRFKMTFLVGVFAALLTLPAQAQDLIRIGWQPSAPISSQIAQVLAKTDILEKNGLKADFKLFSYAPAINEALITGAIDVGFISDFPSVALINSGAPISIVAKQSTFRGSIVVSPKSGITDIKELKGKKLYGPAGSGIHLAAVNMLSKAGLKPGSDVEIINMGFADLSDALNAGRVDAAFIWDPWVENFVEKNLAKVIASDTTLTMVIAARNEFKEKHPGVLERFLKAEKEALLYAALNQDKANAWFLESTAVKALSPKVVQTAMGFDPQWSAKSMGDLNVAFTPTETERYIGLGKQAAELKIFPKVPDVKARLDMSAAQKVDAAKSTFDPKSVKDSK